MPLPSEGPISIGDINEAKGLPRNTPNSSLADLSTTDVNEASEDRPDGDAPHAMSEFLGYDHAAGGDVPEPPTDLVATSGATPSLTWSLDDPGEVDSVEVYRREVGGSFALLDTIGAVETYDDTAAPEDTALEYQVRACGEEGCSLPSNVDGAETRPAAPSGMDASADGTSAVDLTWTVNSELDHTQRLEVRIGGSGNPFVVLEAALPDSETTYRHTGLDAGTQHTYRVRAEGDGGESAFSNQNSATTDAEEDPPNAPSLTSSVQSTSRIDVSRNSVAGADGYRLYASQSSGFTPGAGNLLTSNMPSTFEHTGLDPNETWYYKAIAFNASGDSPPSSQESATTFPEVPLSFSADEDVQNCPSGMAVFLTWDNGGRPQTKVLEWHDGDENWTQIATPATLQPSFLHESPTTDPLGHTNHYRIRFSGESEWAEDSALVGECPT